MKKLAIAAVTDFLVCVRVTLLFCCSLLNRITNAADWACNLAYAGAVRVDRGYRYFNPTAKPTLTEVAESYRREGKAFDIVERDGNFTHELTAD